MARGSAPGLDRAQVIADRVVETVGPHASGAC